MKDIRAIHRSAIELVKQANELLQKGDEKGYIQTCTTAFNLEREAAMELIAAFDAEPTRSVLFRSAATLAFNLGLFDDSLQLVHLGLAGNIYPEMKLEFFAIQQRINATTQSAEKQKIGLENAYLSLLQAKAVNFRVIPKETRYSHAIVLEHIVDFLRNIQTSFLAFTEVNFRKHFLITDFSDYSKTLTSFKKDTKALGVNLHFASFGISIAADTRIMNYNTLNTDKLSTFKSHLFEDFKSEVLLPDYNSKEYLKQVVTKYDDEERSQIFTPIVNTLKDQARYKIEIYNADFSKTIKSIPPLKNTVIHVLKPVKDQAIDEKEEVLLRRTFELTTSEGKKKGTLLSEQFDYFEMTIQIKDLSSGGKSGYFINPYSLQVIFDHGNFLIDDSFYDVYVEDGSYDQLLNKYNAAILKKFDSLLTVETDKLSLDDANILERFKTTIIKGW